MARLINESLEMDKSRKVCPLVEVGEVGLFELFLFNLTVRVCLYEERKRWQKSGGQ